MVASAASPERAAARPHETAGAVLTAKPRYRSNPAPDYPLASRRRQEEGVVLVAVVVEASGAPSAISLKASSGHPLLDQAALDAVRRWTFEPARAASVPISIPRHRARALLALGALTLVSASPPGSCVCG